MLFKITFKLSGATNPALEGYFIVCNGYYITSNNIIYAPLAINILRNMRFNVPAIDIKI